ncbi:formimidoylglutamate deiminase [Aestuariivirga litoralis]|uniref:Formimidoylglutamate deiminase n=1 Tax=Aestuariivirga litoralis TaxID=2650924 RepID=A0A2W2B5F6_9HYPH|nr:formimidoylglutamate deiminase [Aestuariivirga litoralis]PZF75554.1 formimidoylglutamate deiminase [Aestuariivirga litoralis]
MESRKFHFASALTPQGWQRDVTVTVDSGGMISGVAAGRAEGERLSGIAVPAMPNVHSHAHQRFMLGLAERAGPGADSFWTWREAMYGFALRLSPDDLEAVAAQLYVEMLKAGFSIVGEFQYLHHQPDGTPYADPAEMSLRCFAAAQHAGIGITILPTLYAFGGFGGQDPVAGQRRFLNQAERFLKIVDNLSIQAKGDPLRRVGISPHSLRAVTPELLREVVAGLPDDAPIHVHVAEQVKEVDDCLAFSGRRPVELLMESFALSDRWTAIHATHMTPAETAALARSGAIAGLCPTTEANLGDGIFPATGFMAEGGAIAIGSDSHITVSPAEDLRMLEYSQRLRDRTRNALAAGPGQSTGRTLFDAALKGGARSMRQPVGAIAPGYRADITVLDADHPLLAGRREDAALDTWIFSGGNALVKDVIVGGTQVVKDRHHVNEETIARNFRAALRRLDT